MRLIRYIKKNAKSVIVGSLLGLVFLVGCSDDEEPVPVVSDVSYVSLYHGSPDAEGLDIVLNGSGQINALPFEYEDYSNYLNFYSGNRNLLLLDANNEFITVLDTILNFDVDEVYSLFIADSLKSIEVIQVKDSFPNIANGQTMIRIAHLSPDAPTVNISVDGDEVLSDVSFQDISDFLSVDGGRRTVEVSDAATDEVILTIPNLELLDQEYYTIIVNGFVNPPTGNEHDIESDVIKL
ncbi:MAG: DUF4397 domain-containing protein [Bacteroidota bacterium]